MGSENWGTTVQSLITLSCSPPLLSAPHPSLPKSHGGDAFPVLLLWFKISNNAGFVASVSQATAKRLKVTGLTDQLGSCVTQYNRLYNTRSIASLPIQLIMIFAILK
jgi:hypothetical protein